MINNYIPKHNYNSLLLIHIAIGVGIFLFLMICVIMGFISKNNEIDSDTYNIILSLSYITLFFIFASPILSKLLYNVLYKQLIVKSGIKSVNDDLFYNKYIICHCAKLAVLQLIALIPFITILLHNLNNYLLNLPPVLLLHYFSILLFYVFYGINFPLKNNIEIELNKNLGIS